MIYVVIDEPHVEDQGHSYYATEFASDVMKDILPFLGNYPSSSNKKSKAKNKVSKVKLPSTKDGRLIEMPNGGYVVGGYDVAQ